MLEIAGDFHTHTTHSHGTGSVEDNVRAALDRGLRAVAISDHGAGHIFYGIRDMERYLHDIEDARAKYAGQIRVYSGYEGNLQSLRGALDVPVEFASSIDVPFFGYHKMVRYPAPSDWLHFMLPKSSSSSAVQKNTAAVADAFSGNRVLFVSHPGYGLPVNKTELARLAAEKGVALEINAKHPEFTEEELREAANMGVAFIIGSDAHSPGRVGDFRAAVDRAQAAGISPFQILNSAENIDRLIDRLEQARKARKRPGFDSYLRNAYQSNS